MLCLGKPKTKRELVYWHVTDAIYPDANWQVDSLEGCATIDDHFGGRDLSSAEYRSRQFIRLTHPVSALGPGHLTMADHGVSGRKVLSTDTLWVPDTYVGKVFYDVLACALFDLGWDLVIYKDGTVQEPTRLKFVTETSGRSKTPFTVPTLIG